jgi:hypothetical protein
LNNLVGKVLRVTRDGGIPPGNPFTGANSDRCNASGTTTAGRQCREVYAYGLRNPFRFAFDPNAAGTRFFINDVGEQGWDEIDAGQAGANYGWPCREGAHPMATTGACSPPPPSMVDPIHEYAHSTGCSSITAGAFVPNGVWPGEYAGDYLYADYVCGRMFVLEQTAAGYAARTFATGLGANTAIAMTFGPHGAGRALYYASFVNGGEVHRVTFDTQTPVAAFTANPASGPLPLTVRFDASSSQDPLGRPLTYNWAFGDGGTLNGATSPTTQHTYTQGGVYTATLVVRNSAGETSTPAQATIRAGNSPPVPVINQPAASLTFSVGRR